MHHLESNLEMPPKAYIQNRFFLGRDKELAAMATMELDDDDRAAMKAKGNVCEILGRAMKGGSLCYEVRKTGDRPGVTRWEPAEFLKAPYVAKMTRHYDEKLKASQEEAMEKARLAAEALQQQQKKATRCVAELEINDYPQMARQKVISRDSLMAIQEMAQVVIITKGQYYAPGRNPPAGERKLYLLIEGETEDVVKAARKELRRQLGEYAETAAPQQDSKYGKYSV